VRLCESLGERMCEGVNVYDCVSLQEQFNMQEDLCHQRGLAKARDISWERLRWGEVACS
jgi:hypothetical protein